MYLHIYVPYLLTYFLSLYPFAVPKPEFLYKTASLQQGGAIEEVDWAYWFRVVHASIRACIRPFKNHAC